MKGAKRITPADARSLPKLPTCPMSYGEHDVTLWDVIARIPGRTAPNRWVVGGNHRDAWTYGAVDPNSGTAVLLELARGLGVLRRHG